MIFILWLNELVNVLLLNLFVFGSLPADGWHRHMPV